MGKKAKGAVLIKLVSMAGTGFFYMTKKKSIETRENCPAQIRPSDQSAHPLQGGKD